MYSVESTGACIYGWKNVCGLKANAQKNGSALTLRLYRFIFNAAMCFYLTGRTNIIYFILQAGASVVLLELRLGNLGLLWCETEHHESLMDLFFDIFQPNLQN